VKIVNISHELCGIVAKTFLNQAASHFHFEILDNDRVEMSPFML